MSFTSLEKKNKQNNFRFLFFDSREKYRRNRKFWIIVFFFFSRIVKTYVSFFLTDENGNHELYLPKVLPKIRWQKSFSILLLFFPLRESLKIFIVCVSFYSLLRWSDVKISGYGGKKQKVEYVLFVIRICSTSFFLFNNHIIPSVLRLRIIDL